MQKNNLNKPIGVFDSGFGGLTILKEEIVRTSQLYSGINAQQENILVSNGGKHAILTTFMSILNPGDEVLIPAPDYPLWTAAVSLSGGNPIHYHCDEQADWFPDLVDIESKITANTRALVVINPNNPTGAVYSK
mgnify:CR=1 FL=1